MSDNEEETAAVKYRVTASSLPEGHPDFYKVPEKFEGKSLPWNYYCRAWNGKREKYCNARAGQGTDHLGSGRCKNHGGSTPYITGRYAEVPRGKVADHLERLEMETEEEQLNILPEARMLRAVLADYIERFDEFRDAIIAYNDDEMLGAQIERRKPVMIRVPDLAEVGKLLEGVANIVDKVHKQRQANAISRKDFFRLMGAMALIVNKRIDEIEKLIGQDRAEKVKKSIQEDWKKIQLQSL